MITPIRCTRGIIEKELLIFFAIILAMVSIVVICLVSAYRAGGIEGAASLAGLTAAPAVLMWLFGRLFLGVGTFEALVPSFMIFMLCLIALPKFQKLYRRTMEHRTIENLETLRKSVSENGIPEAVPPASPYPHHEKSSAVLRAPAANDDGGWTVDLSGDKAAVFINCTHTDSRDRLWNAF